VWAGYHLMRRSAQGLLDRALPPEQLTVLEGVLRGHRARGVDFHALRTRQAGARAFISVHVLVPGDWTVERGHDFAHQVENDIRQALPEASVLTHVEPLGHPESYRDMGLDQ